MENKPVNYIYQLSVNSSSNEEFSLELFDYKEDFECNGSPCKTISCFEELLSVIDELEEENL